MASLESTPSASDPSRVPSVMLRVGIILGTPLLVLAILGLRPRAVDLLIHNGHDAPVRCTIDEDLQSESAYLLDPHQTQRLTLTRAGRHTLRYAVQAQDGPSGELNAELASAFAQTRSSYVWDVGGAVGKAWIVHRGYGTSTTPRAERLVLDEITLIPRDVLPRLNEGFPEQIREKKAQTGGVRSVLWTDRHADSVRPRRALVFLDNRSQAQLRLWAGERLLGTAPRGEVLGVRLPAGSHHLRAVEVGAAEAVMSEHAIDVELDVPPLAPSPGFVWRPLGDDPEYVILSRSYGDFEDEIPDLEPYSAPSAFFPLPAGLVPSLNAFPIQLDVPRGQAGALRRALFTPLGARTPDARRSMQGLTDELLKRVMEQAPEDLQPH